MAAARDAPVGGQAVLEGVMMRGVRTWAVATRDLRGEAEPGGASEPIHVQRFPLETALQRHRWMRLPIIRGNVALVSSLRIGYRALGLSAQRALPAGEREKLTPGLFGGTIALALALAVGLFFLLPALIAALLGGIDNGVVFVVVEKAVRIAIFLAYIAIVSRLGHLQRVFQYHGAEHQAIACHEAGEPLEPERAARFSRLHPRCGTSFLLLVMLVAIVVFAPLGKLPLGWLLVSRVVGIPLVAGLAFEVIRFSGRHRDAVVAKVVTWPGLQLQRLTTRTPTLDQLAVAIAALTAVLAAERDDDATADDLVGLEVVA